MVHAKLHIAAENSGKLVSMVRTKAKEIAKENERDLVVIDGPPGIGCPVIASVSGSDAVLVVSEPTMSGKHDLERVLKLALHFKVPAYVCINKADINNDMSDQIEALAKELEAKPVGRVNFNSIVTEAQVAGKTVVEFAAESQTANEITHIWNAVHSELTQAAAQV